MVIRKGRDVRAEFSKAVRRAALERSGGMCEASGLWYGLPEGKRCFASLAHGVQFDHAIADAIGGAATLENCVCACLPCHLFKTRTRDIPLAAKTVRQRDKNNGIKRRSTMPGSRDSAFKKKMDGTVERR